jgi:tRNA threonylcarbamoyladenosine biosynthesis protein TsaB
MNILAADTSTPIMNLALVTDNGCTSFSLEDGMHHSENLVPAIIELLKKRNISLKDLDLLACTAGPGSFTGLRIAMSALKGISSATATPLVSVKTMDLLASFTNFYPGVRVVAIDARKKRFYIALYRGDKRLCPDLDCHESEVIEMLQGEDHVLITGPDSDLFSKKLIEAGIKDIRLDIDNSPKNIALQLAQLAAVQFEAQGADPIGSGPVYVRKSDAEIALEKRIQALREEA